MAALDTPPVKSDELHDGSMSTYSKPYNAGSTSTRRRCAGGGRDGATRTRLQSHPRHEHHGHRAAYGRDQGIANTSPTPRRVCQSARRFQTTKTLVV